MRRTGTIVLLVLAVALLGGCGSTPVAEDVSQSQANEIVTLLNSHGISAVAQRSSGGKGMYSVTLESGSYSDAVALITANKLPAEKKLSFGELTAPSGLVPNSREMEALRLDRALATEIEDTLSNHPLVETARVVVRQNFLKDGASPSVSVVLTERPGKKVPVDEIRQIVLRAVPGVKPDDVFVSSNEAAERASLDSKEGIARTADGVIRVPLVPFLLWKVPESNYYGLARTLIASMLIMLGLGAVLGYWYSMYRNAQGGAGTTTYLPDGEPKILRIERQKKDSGEL